jgi:hypothetical protein
MKKMETIKELCEKSWDDALSPHDVKRLMNIKRMKIRSDLPVRSFSDFISLPRNYWDDPALYFSVLYAWNGRGFSALKPFCVCKKDGDMHPLHVHYLHLDY